VSIFSNLLTGSPGTQTQTSQLAPGAQGLATSLFDTTSAMASRPYTPYTGQRVAGLTPDQLAAMQGSRDISGRAGDLYGQLSTDMAGSQFPGMLGQAGDMAGQMAGIGQGALNYLPGMGSAAGQSGALANVGSAMVPGTIGGTLDLAQRFPDIDINSYMNPYVNEVINPALEDMSRRLSARRNQLDSRSAMTGSFGGSRNAVAQQMLEGEGQREMGRLNAEGRAKAFNEAANQFRFDQSYIPKLYADAYGQLNSAQGLQRGAITDSRSALGGSADAQRLLQGGMQGMGALASLENMGYDRTQRLNAANQGLLGTQVQPLLATGALAQGNQQASLDKMYSDFLEQRDWSGQGLNQLRQTLGLGAVATPTRSTTTMPDGPSTASQIIGGGTALAGALGGVSGAGNWLSKLFGAGGKGWGSGVEMTADGGGFLFKRGGLVGVGG